MNKFRTAALFVFALFLAPVIAMAADDPAAATTAAASSLSLATIGAGIILLAAGYGIGQIGCHAVDSMARQPEAAGSIQTAMIISEALIEGVTFFALIICLLK
ncbi:MAG: ATP synthase F0 subunit C [Thermoguttaceae bacterium]|nr:ATP synthase F0 subunit C [Thermoguttaceae bacterium]